MFAIKCEPSWTDGTCEHDLNDFPHKFCSIQTIINTAIKCCSYDHVATMYD